MRLHSYHNPVHSQSSGIMATAPTVPLSSGDMKDSTGFDVSCLNQFMNATLAKVNMTLAEALRTLVFNRSSSNTNNINRTLVELLCKNQTMNAANNVETVITEIKTTSHGLGTPDAVLYIVAVLSFYAIAMVLLMVKYIQRQTEDEDEFDLYFEECHDVEELCQLKTHTCEKQTTLDGLRPSVLVDCKCCEEEENDKNRGNKVQNKTLRKKNVRKFRSKDDLRRLDHTTKQYQPIKDWSCEEEDIGVNLPPLKHTIVTELDRYIRSGSSESSVENELLREYNFNELTTHKSNLRTKDITCANDVVSCTAEKNTVVPKIQMQDSTLCTGAKGSVLLLINEMTKKKINVINMNFEKPKIVKMLMGKNSMQHNNVEINV